MQILPTAMPIAEINELSSNRPTGSGAVREPPTKTAR